MPSYHYMFVIIRESIAWIGVLVISLGVLSALFEVAHDFLHKRVLNINIVRLRLGQSIILGLEFLVAADIIGSVVQPDYYNLGLLVILVGVRTALSYFLNKELRALERK